MLGLFIVLPVFALEAARLPGGDDPARVGFAMGLYGLTQAFLQIPFGLASDRFGRKPTIVTGLLVFAVGSAIAAWAPDLTWLAVGRAVQGAGAISAAVTAFLADVTRDNVRTKAMAMVGASIALMFAVSLVLAPLLAGWVGLSGIFAITCALALTGIAVVIWVAPPEPRVHQPAAVGQIKGKGLGEVLRHPGLMRLNFGVFVLHAVQLAMWMAVPALAGAGRVGQSGALAGVPAGRSGFAGGDGRCVVPHGAPGPSAHGLPDFHRPDRGGAGGPMVDRLNSGHHRRPGCGRWAA